VPQPTAPPRAPLLVEKYEMKMNEEEHIKEERKKRKESVKIVTVAV
jgi:hypothetical protein